MNMQTILGSGGPIGIELAKELPKFTENIKLVSRNPKHVMGNEKLVKANLLNLEDVEKAVEGSDVVYLTAGLKYNIKVWQNEWPAIMNNVIESCKKHNSKLVFFDNIYMYDEKHLSNMTEETPQNPVSKKGKVRKLISDKLLQEIEKGSIKALIARSADFYGPSIKNNSMLTETVFNKLAKNKKADWFGTLDKKHSFTYTPDAGKATALLGNTDEAFGQVWHLPTMGNPFTGGEWINSIANELSAEAKVRVTSKTMLNLLGLFIPIMKELSEMFYQYDRDYVFNSSKFENKFDIKPTPYLNGIKEIIQADYSLVG
jgi:nucleoside-diphosphate-sugar epimerase